MTMTGSSGPSNSATAVGGDSADEERRVTCRRWFVRKLRVEVGPNADATTAEIRTKRIVRVIMMNWVSLGFKSKLIP